MMSPFIEVDTLDIDDDESYIKASTHIGRSFKVTIKLYGIY